jgi:Arc/MetJ family transcription regulator
MRTTLDLNDDLMAALMRRHPGATKTRAVEQAIASHLRTDALAKLRDLARRIDIEDASSELRKIDRRA